MSSSTRKKMLLPFYAVLVYVVWLQVLFMLRQEGWLRRSWKVGAFANRLATTASKEAANTARYELRAYVGPTDHRFYFDAGSGRPKIAFTNYGILQQLESASMQMPFKAGPRVDGYYPAEDATTVPNVMIQPRQRYPLVVDRPYSITVAFFVIGLYRIFRHFITVAGETDSPFGTKRGTTRFVPDKTLNDEIEIEAT